MPRRRKILNLLTKHFPISNMRLLYQCSPPIFTKPFKTIILKSNILKIIVPGNLPSSKDLMSKAFNNINEIKVHISEHWCLLTWFWCFFPPGDATLSLPCESLGTSCHGEISYEQRSP